MRVPQNKANRQNKTLDCSVWVHNLIQKRRKRVFYFYHRVRILAMLGLLAREKKVTGTCYSFLINHLDPWSWLRCEKFPQVLKVLGRGRNVPHFLRKNKREWEEGKNLSATDTCLPKWGFTFYTMHDASQSSKQWAVLNMLSWNEV